jgi:hypothetical protein
VYELINALEWSAPPPFDSTIGRNNDGSIKGIQRAMMAA